MLDYHVQNHLLAYGGDEEFVVAFQDYEFESMLRIAWWTVRKRVEHLKKMRGNVESVKNAKVSVEDAIKQIVRCFCGVPIVSEDYMGPVRVQCEKFVDRLVASWNRR